MKRHEKLQPLSREHHDGLLLAQLFKKDAPPYKGLPTELPDKVAYGIEQFQKVILPHFKKEEEELIPFVRSRDEALEEQINAILQEHKDIRSGFEALDKGTYSEDQVDFLGHLLERHIRREEREFFQQIQEILSEEELKELPDLD